MGAGLFETGGIVIILIVLIGILAILIIRLSMKVHRIDVRYKRFLRGNDGRSLEKMLIDNLDDVEKIKNRSRETREAVRSYEYTLRKMPQRYGIVRYDAFDDVGGKMSFALALVNDENTGFILNTVHSQDNCFLYIKEVVNGESFVVLSGEEIEALNRAVNSREEAKLSENSPNTGKRKKPPKQNREEPKDERRSKKKATEEKPKEERTTEEYEDELLEFVDRITHDKNE